jgi:hypothetical protein
MLADGALCSARGRRMFDLPPNRAPVFFAGGFVVYLAAVIDGGVRRGSTDSALLACAGLALFATGALFTWLGLTRAGRVLVALPLFLGVASVVAARAGATTLAVVFVFPAFALFLTATVLLVDRHGVYMPAVFQGRIDPTFVRTHRDGGPVECRLSRSALEVVSGSGASDSTPLSELGLPRVTVQGGASDLVVVDRFGDEVLRLRAQTHEERREANALAKELKKRVLGV